MSRKVGCGGKPRRVWGSGSRLVFLWLVLFLVFKPASAAKPSKATKGGAGGEDRSAAQKEAGETEPWGVVRAVVTGSRVVVVTPEEARIDVRLLGVEPPVPPRPAKQGRPADPGQQYGVEAERYLRELLLDKQVQLETHGKDQSGRTLAVVWLGNINVNLTLVKEGLAWMSPSISVPRVRAEMEVAERQARVARYGLWALPSPQAPWEYRRQHHLPVE